MNIYSNYTNRNECPSFKGQLKLIGNATDWIKKSFYENKTLKQLAESSEYDIVGIIKSRNAADYEIYKEGRDEILYKFAITTQKQLKGFWNKFMNFLKPRPVIKPTRNYHSEETTIKIIDKYTDADIIKKELNI